uniref:Uncharacterized protein n=1 Tax=Panagrolaimus sp. PS1159 TaxID=55785 RepID=A0AC35FYQ5_9BILA
MSSDELEMAKQSFLGSINYLKRMTKCDFNDITNFYSAGYDFARLTRFHSAEFTLDQKEKEEFINNFPIALEKATGLTRGLYNNMSPESMNELKALRSQIVFIKTDFTNLYSRISNNEKSIQELKKSIEELQKEENNIESYLMNWSASDGEGMNDPDDVPNLNGVPESHDWWTQENRNLWKTKNS